MVSFWGTWKERRRREKDLIHDADDLEGEHVLTEIVTRLEDDSERRAVWISIDKDKPEGQLLRVHETTLFEDETTGLPRAIERQLETVRQTNLGQLSQHDITSISSRNEFDVVGDRAKGVHDLILACEVVEMLTTSIQIGLKEETKTLADLRHVHL